VTIPQTIAIIPARGGSKGIPRKNLLPFAGIPLLAHSIDHAHAAQGVDLVVVTTDDDEIAAVAPRHGATVVRRPAAIAGDEATSESALLHALDVIESDLDIEPGLVVFLQATSPIRPAGVIDRAVELVENGTFDSVLTASPQHSFTWESTDEGARSLTYDHRQRPRRQDLPAPRWEENGSVYVTTAAGLRRSGNRLSGTIGIVQMHPLDSFQIDEPGDVEMLETIRRLRNDRLEDPECPRNLADIALLVLDFDGVLTDNAVMVSEDGLESVRCNRSDGWGIARLREQGVEVVIMSTETNAVVSARARKLAVEAFSAVDDKATALQRLIEQKRIDAARVAFVGNDVNDLPAMEVAGLAIAVADAVPDVRRAAHLVTEERGGQGAVREVCDLLIAAHRSSP
jgi:N-acylneuraminate cytidylyltransferase